MIHPSAKMFLCPWNKKYSNRVCGVWFVSVRLSDNIQHLCFEQAVHVYFADIIIMQYEKYEYE